MDTTTYAHDHAREAAQAAADAWHVATGARVAAGDDYPESVSLALSAARRATKRAADAADAWAGADGETAALYAGMARDALAEAKAQAAKTGVRA